MPVNPFQMILEEDRKDYCGVKQQEEQALSGLYDRYAPILYSLGMRMLRSVEDTENIVHDLYIELWNQPDKYQHAQVPLTEWMLTRMRARSVASDRIKHLKKQSQQAPNHILPIYSEYVLSHPSTIPLPENLLQSLIAVFQQLNEEEQQILALGFYEGWSESEIAKKLNIPPWTVAWSLRKSLHQIASVIGYEQNDPQETEHKKYLELCVAVQVGIANKNENNALEEHLASGCTICKDEITKLSAAAILLPLGLPQVPLLPELKERILFSIRLTQVVKSANEKQEKTVPKVTGQEILTEHNLTVGEKPEKRIVLRYVLFGMLSVALVVGGMIVLPKFKSIVFKNSQSSEQEGMIEQLLKVIERKNAYLNVLESEHLNIIHFTSTQQGSASNGNLFWDPKTRIGLLHLTDLPRTSENENYTLWLVRNQQEINVAVFNIGAEEKGENFFRIQLPSDVAMNNMKEFLITRESVGGTVEPAGTVLLRGKPHEE